MSEDITKGLHGGRPSEERVLAELSSMRVEFGRRFDSLETRLASVETRLDSMETRLTSLEEKVDERLREARPIWESVQAQLKQIDKRLDTLNRHFKKVIQDLYDLRGRVEKIEDSQPLDEL